MRLVDFLKDLRNKIENILKTCENSEEACILEYASIGTIRETLEKLKNSALAMYLADRDKRAKMLYDLLKAIVDGYFPCHLARYLNRDEIIMTMRDFLTELDDVIKMFEGEELYIYSTCIVKGRPEIDKLSRLAATCESGGGYYRDGKMYATNGDVLLYASADDPSRISCLPYITSCDFLIKNLTNCERGENGEATCIIDMMYHNLHNVFKVVNRVEQYKNIMRSITNSIVYSRYVHEYPSYIAELSVSSIMKDFETPLVEKVRNELDLDVSNAFGKRE